MPRRRNTTRLTEDQRNRITEVYQDCLNLTFSMVRRRPFDPDEVYTATHDSLVSCARAWQPGRGRSFTSLFHLSVGRELWKLHRSHQRHPQVHLPLDRWHELPARRN